ncbi:MAG: alkaline phosphatase family protein [Dysgonamonadaceae bacterium]
MIKILTSLFAFFSIAAVHSQSIQQTPKLVIGITIDQLRGDYLELFKDTFGDKGFKKLLNEGLVYSDVEFNFPYLDEASTTTTIYTGTNPTFHGIQGNSKYLIKQNKEVSSFTDISSTINNADDQLSPSPIIVSTLTDELSIASGDNSDIFSFAPNAISALSSGGHTARGSYWVDDYNGRWITSKYYNASYSFVEKHNGSNESLYKKGLSLVWKPSMPIANYDAFPYTRNIIDFQHQLGATKNNRFHLLKQSPFINSDVRKMAENALIENKLGTRTYPDFLSLTFYAGNYENALDKNYSIEIQDIYYRLDQELAQLFETIDKTIGLDNTLIFVVSTGYFNEQEIYPEGIKLSGGEFNPEKIRALLNMYLMAVYGQGEWVTKYYNQQYFLDRDLIEDKKIPLADIQQIAAEFLVHSSGIHDVITSHQMLHGAYNQTVQYYRNSYCKGVSGDLFVELQPGWSVVNDNSSTNIKTRSNAVISPAIFFGNNIKPQRISTPIDATQIAPSVAYRLRIRAPNASKGEILKELLN